MTPPRALVGCETSGRVRRALERAGLDVWSVDILPADDGSNRHIVGDVRDYLTGEFDLLCVMHPPCTRLCNSGVRWLDTPTQRVAPSDATDPEKDAWPRLTLDQRRVIMRRLLADGADLFSACWNAPIRHRAVENPVMHKHAKALIQNYQPPAQTVQPWHFGEPAFKATSFYLAGLPPLKPTNRLTPPKAGTADHKAWSAVHRASPGADRWKIRSQTFRGIADAIGAQWGGHVMQGAA